MIHGKTVGTGDKCIIVVCVLFFTLILLCECNRGTVKGKESGEPQTDTSLSGIESESIILEGESAAVKIIKTEVYTYTTRTGEVILAPYPIITQNGNTKLDMINDTIKVAFTEWLDDSCGWVSNGIFSVIAQSDSLVTIEEEIVGSPRDGTVRLFCTIDMTTGDRKLFSDLFEIDEELFKNFSTIKNDLGNNIWSSTERSERVIEQLCMTEKEFLESMRVKEGYAFSEASTWGLLRAKSCFYLSDNGIVVAPEGALSLEIHCQGDGSFALSP